MAYKNLWSPEKLKMSISALGEVLLTVQYQSTKLLQEMEIYVDFSLVNV